MTKTAANNPRTPDAIVYLIVTYNGERHVANLLGSIPPRSRVIVVDNASTDRTRAILEERKGDPSRGHVLDTVYLPENRGYASGINAGMERIGTSAEWALVLNQDIVLNSPLKIGGAGGGTIARTDFRLSTFDPYAIVQPRILLPDGTVNVDELRMNVWGFVYPPNYGTRPEPQPPRETLLFSGAAFLLNVQRCQSIGPFDESLFMYYEEIDYALRLASAGEKVLFDPTWTVTHDYTVLGSWKKIFWQVRNRGRILQRYASPLHQLLTLTGWPTKKNKILKNPPPSTGGSGWGTPTNYRLVTTNLLLGFHTRQIPQPLRFLVNCLAVPLGWMIRTMLNGASSRPLSSRS